MDASDEVRVLLWEIIVINIDNIDIDDIDINDIESEDIDSDDIDSDYNDIEKILMICVDTSDIDFLWILMILIYQYACQWWGRGSSLRNDCHLMSILTILNIDIAISRSPSFEYPQFWLIGLVWC